MRVFDEIVKSKKDEETGVIFTKLAFYFPLFYALNFIIAAILCASFRLSGDDYVRYFPFY